MRSSTRSPFSRRRGCGGWPALGGAARFAILGALLFAAAAAVGVDRLLAAGADVERPNIVFILADDLGINDLACYGRADQATPALDRLASQGLRFTNAYAAQSVCSPSRAAIMTGKTPARLHITTFLPGRRDTDSQLLTHPHIQQHLPLAEETLAERLKPLGYASICVGKWHLGGKGYLPTEQGFDAYHPGKGHTHPSATEGGKGEFDLTAAAEEFIEAHSAQPFFVYLCHYCPHVPLAAQSERIERHSGAFNPTYAAMVETLDESVGRIVAQIDRLGLAERTIIIFTSDNGGLHVPELPITPATHNTPYRAGKGFCYEGGVRVPAIVRWPGHAPANRVVDAPVIGADWTPTLLEMAGAPAMTGADGVSLAALIARGEAPRPRMLFWHQPHYTNQGGRPSGAVRDGRWKLIEHYEDGACELFDLESDAGETRDLSAERPGDVARLRGALEQWRRDVESQSNTFNPDFDPAAWAPLYRDVDASRLPAAKTFQVGAAALEDWRDKMNKAVKERGSEATPDRPTGAIALEARDAKTHGAKLHYEPAAQKDTLGAWTNREDWVEWSFTAPRAGTYEVNLLQACGPGSGGATIDIAVDDQKISTTVVETGHFQRFVPRAVGKLRISSAGPHTLTVRAATKPGPAVMDLRRVSLIAATD